MHVCCLTQEFFIQQQGLQTVLYTSDRARVENDAHQQSSGIAERQQRCFTQLANSKPHIWKPVENLLKYGVLRVWIWKLPGRHGSDPRPKPTGATSIRKLLLLCWNSFYIYIYIYIYIVYIVYRYIHSILYIYIHTYIFLYVYIRIYLPRTLDLSQEACCIMLHLCPGALGIGPPRIQRSRSFAILSIHCQRHVPTSASRCTKSRENINHVGRSNDTKDFFGCPLAIATVQTEML